MAKKKITKRSRYQPLRLLQNGGGVNAYYQNLFETDQRYQLPNTNLANINQSNLTGLGNNQVSNIGDQGSSFGVGDITSNLGYGAAAVNLIGNISDGEFTGTEAQQTVDTLGSAVGGAYYAGGKAVDELLFAKDPKTGEFNSDLAAQASFAITDPSQTIGQAVDTFGEGDIGKGIGELLLPGLAGLNYQNEAEAETARIEEEKRKRQRTIESFRIAEQRGANLGANPNIVVRNGGYLPKKQNGGPISDPNKRPIGRDATGNIIYTTNPVDTTSKAYYTPNVYRPRTRTNTVDTLVDEFDFNREEALNRYSPELLDSIANTTSRFQSGITSLGEPTLNEIIPNVGARVQLQNGGNISENNGTPIIRKYTGQTHSGENGGIEVDQEGNPTAITGKQGIALTEKGEVNFSGYIFSDNIKYTG